MRHDVLVIPPAAEPELRRLLARVDALDLDAVTAAPTGDRAYAAACLARWQHAVHALVDPDGTVRRALQALDASPAELAHVDFLEARDPSPPRPGPCTLAWAEAPLSHLVDPAVLTDEDSLDCFGWYHGGLTSSYVPAIDRLRDALLHTAGIPAYGLDLPDTYTATTMAIDTPSATFVRGLLYRLAGGVVRDMLSLALLHPRLRVNPYEHELELIERGLFPLGIDDGECRVFRHARVPITAPAWLPEFTLAHPPG